MNLNTLHYFKILAEVKQFTKAAELLYISQPSLTVAIRKLEDELQTELFERQGHTLSLTKYGEIFLQYAEIALNALDTGTNLIKEHRDLYYGNINIGSVYHLGQHFIAQLLTSFTALPENKNLTFQIYQETSYNLLDMLAKAQLHAAFVALKERENIFYFKPVLQSEFVFVVVVSAKHPLANRKEISIHELERYEFIDYSQTNSMKMHIDHLYKKHDFQPKIRLRVSEEHALFSFVEQNLGIAISLNFRTIVAFNIKAIKLKEHIDPLNIYLAYRKNCTFMPSTTKFLDYVSNFSKLNERNFKDRDYEKYL